MLVVLARASCLGANLLAYVDIEVGRRIRQRREELGWSREKLAKQLDIPPSDISDYEEGLLRPDGRMLVRIAAVTDRPPSHFFPDLGAPPSC